MREFTVSIRSFQDVKDFVSLATIQPFRVLVGNGRQWVSAKSFMGMFSLDYRTPVRVRMDCTDSQYDSFHDQAARFLAE